jgi:hypothetical protein
MTKIPKTPFCKLQNSLSREGKRVVGQPVNSIPDVWIFTQAQKGITR